MKKWILFFTVFFTCCMSVSVCAEEETPLAVVLSVDKTKFMVNGKEKQFHTPPYIAETGYTMLPIREVAEIFPHTHVDYDSCTKSAKITQGTAHRSAVYIAKNQDLMKKENQWFLLETTAAEKNGRMFISLRDMCRICHIPAEDVLWDKETKTVTIHTTPIPPKSDADNAYSRLADTFTPVKEDIPYFRCGDDSSIAVYLQKNVDPDFSPEKFQKEEIGQYGSRTLSYSYEVGGVPSDFLYIIDIEENKMVGWKKTGIPLYDYVLPKGYSVEEKKKEWLDIFHKKKTNLCTNRWEETVTATFDTEKKAFRYVIRIVCHDNDAVYVVPITCPLDFPAEADSL